MPSFRNQRLVNHSAQDMFDLVADVETYPDFLPLCTGLRIRKRQQDQQGREVLIADMSVGYKAIRETFTSKVTLDRDKKEILVEYVDGPFERLINRWTFSDEAEMQEGKREYIIKQLYECQIALLIENEGSILLSWRYVSEQAKCAAYY